MNFHDFSQKPPARGAPIFTKMEQYWPKVHKSNFFAKGRRVWDSRLVTIVKIKVSKQTIAKKQKLRCKRTPTDQNWSKRGAILEQNRALFGENSAKMGVPVAETGHTHPSRPRSSRVVFRSPWDRGAPPPHSPLYIIYSIYI